VTVLVILVRMARCAIYLVVRDGKTVHESKKGVYHENRKDDFILFSAFTACHVGRGNGSCSGGGQDKYG